MDGLKSLAGLLCAECKIVYLWSVSELEAICSAQSSHEAPPAVLT